MSFKRSPGSFCSLVVAALTGSSNSIAAINVNAVGDGAEAYCTGLPGTYRYNASLSQGTLVPQYVAPNSGPGCWVYQDTGQYLAMQINGTTAFNGGSTPTAPVLNTWNQLPQITNAYAVNLAPAASNWAVNTTSGQFTYTGPNALNYVYLLTSTVAIAGAGTASPQVWDYTLAANGALVGTTTDDFQSMESQVSASAGAMSIITHSLIIQPANLSVYQYLIRCRSSSPSTPTFFRFSCCITAL